MTEFDSSGELPEEFQDVADRLRAGRPTFSPLELDQVKLSALSRTNKGNARRRPLVSRWLTLGLATVILGGTAATGLAAGGCFGGHGQNAAWSQYQPGHPCKPKDHFPWAYGYKGEDPCTPVHPIHRPPPPPPPKSWNDGKGKNDSPTYGQNNGSNSHGR